MVGGLEQFFQYIGNSNPNWLSNIFQMGGYTTNHIIINHH